MKNNKVLIALSLLYVIWPLDFMPDFLPALGWLDDIGVLGHLGYRLIKSNQGGSHAP